jgi:AcrR family transcriptional regulator
MVRKRSPKDEPALSRGERKLRTRQSLIDTVLTLIADDRAFTSLSLREIARGAGVAPNAFYRHFDDVESLGLAVLDEGGLTLRRLLRSVREAGLPEREVVRRSVDTYVAYVRAHHAHFLFVVRERVGGSAVIREAVRREIGHFASDMAADFESYGWFGHVSAQTRRLIADVVVGLMLDAAVEILDLPRDAPERERELVERLVRHLVLVFLGAAAWRDPASLAPSTGTAGSAESAGRARPARRR